jgi:hypothetical protein
MLNGTNFSDWKEQVQFHLSVLDLDIALHEFEKPPIPLIQAVSKKRICTKHGKSQID